MYVLPAMPPFMGGLILYIKIVGTETVVGVQCGGMSYLVKCFSP